MLTAVAPPDSPSAARNDVHEGGFVAWLQKVNLVDAPYLAPNAGMPARRGGDLPNLTQADARDEIRLCQGILEDHGLELLVLDQTRPDVGMPVVKVVVPGLRHLWARFAPGRLYDVPVRLGWLPEPTHEDGLNPVPITI
jgi:ribosomal protein S12 methylthiotransferase accessory factor